MIVKYSPYISLSMIKAANKLQIIIGNAICASS